MRLYSKGAKIIAAALCVVCAFVFVLSLLCTAVGYAAEFDRGKGEDAILDIQQSLAREEIFWRIGGWMQARYAYSEPIGAPVPTAAPMPVPTAEVQPVPTGAPMPTPTPAPTQTPAQETDSTAQKAFEEEMQLQLLAAQEQMDAIEKQLRVMTDNNLTWQVKLLDGEGQLYRMSRNVIHSYDNLSAPTTLLFTSTQGYFVDDACAAQVELSVFLQNALPKRDIYSFADAAMRLCEKTHRAAPFICLGSILLGGALVIFLCFAAGRQGKNAPQAGFLHRIFLEFVLLADVAAAIAIAGLIIVIGENAQFLVRRPVLVLVLFALAFLAAALLVIYTCMTVCVRIKTRTVLKSSILGRIALFAIKLLRRLGAWLLGMVRAVPQAWKLVLGAVFLSIMMLIFLNVYDVTGFVIFLWILLSALLVFGALKAGSAMTRLFSGAEKIVLGDAEKIDLAGLHGQFLSHAQTLNRLGDSIDAAVGARLKSERLKTELITNVSHDIRTPLTNIISYLDLLEKEQDEQMRAQYLATAMAHAQRLKKMTEDLIEASKAATGNVPVALEKCDLNELIAQCLGEYEARFAAAQLTPVVQMQPCTVLADGQLLWRVLDNLLGNACKYAMPNTRVYLSAEAVQGAVSLAVKNTSREALNVSAEELMERFVRGDSARSGEGSGLGLSIARSLCEAMGGSFKLAIDGDLFKCILSFRCADAATDAGESGGSGGSGGSAPATPLRDSVPETPAGDFIPRPHTPSANMPTVRELFQRIINQIRSLKR